MARVFSWLQGEFRGIPLLPRERGARWLLLVILVIGVYLRTAGLSWAVAPGVAHPSPYHDEAHNLAMAFSPKFFEEFDEFEIARPVYFYRLAAAPWAWLGEVTGLNSPNDPFFEFLLLRSITAASGILTLYLVYLLGATMAHTGVGLLASAFMVVLPGHVWLSQLIKGDAIATFFIALSLFVAMMVYERGTPFWYLTAGVSAGVGLATKLSYATALPVFLVAHVARVIRLRRPQELLGGKSLAAVGGGLVLFALLYPYPYVNWPRFWRAVTQPTIQFWRVNLEFSPQQFSSVWRSYENPQQPYLTVIYGDVVPTLFLLGLPLFLAYMVRGFWVERHKAVFYLLVVTTLVMVYHSLSFSGLISARYSLILAPFFALVAARLLILDLLPRAQSLPFTLIRSSFLVLGAMAVLYTGLFSGAYFVPYVLKEPRKEAAAYLHTHAAKKTVGEFAPHDRQSLPLDGQRLTILPLEHHDAPKLVALHFPDYVVLQRPPEHLDSDFKAPDPKLWEQELRRLQRYYDLVATFGAPPQLLGRVLPRTLQTPIVDIYRRRDGVEVAPLVRDFGRGGAKDWELVNEGFEVAPLQEGLRLSPGRSVFFVPWDTFTRAELEGSFFEVAFDLTELRPRGREAAALALVSVLHFEGAASEGLPDALGSAALHHSRGRERRAALKRLEGHPGAETWVYQYYLPLEAKAETGAVRLVTFFRDDDGIDFYLGLGESLVLFQSEPRSFARARWGFGVYYEGSPETGSLLVPSVRLRRLEEAPPALASPSSSLRPE